PVIDEACMAAKLGRAATRAGLPDSGGAIETGGEDVLAAGTEHCLRDPARMPDQLSQWLAGGRFPDSRRAIAASGYDRTAIRTKPSGRPRPHGAPQRSDASSRRRLPALRRPTLPPGEEVLIVWIEERQIPPAAVADQIDQISSGPGVPDSSGPISAG